MVRYIAPHGSPEAVGRVLRRWELVEGTRERWCGRTVRSPRDRSVPFALECRRDWKAPIRDKVSTARSAGATEETLCSCRMAARASLRSRCCGRVGISPGSLLRSCGHLSGLVVAVVWASLRARCCGRVGISPGSLLRSCGHLSGLVVAVVWAFFCGLFICLSVCRMGLPLRVVYLSVCLSYGPSSAGSLLPSCGPFSLGALLPSGPSSAGCFCLSVGRVGISPGALLPSEPSSPGALLRSCGQAFLFLGLSIRTCYHEFDRYESNGIQTNVVCITP